MKVSVIIPSYNAGAYLAQAVSSVRKQQTSFSLNTEIIVIDDGSTDGSVEQLQVLAAEGGLGPVLKILHQDHQGASAARNYGMKEATGEYLLFLDADDVLAPDAIEALYQGLLQNPDAVIALGMAEEFISEELDAKTASGLSKKELPFGAFLSGCCFGKKEALLKVGFFDINLKGGGTVDWLARLRDSGLKTVQLIQVTVRRRIHLTNLGRVHEQEQMQGYATIIRKRLLARRKSKKTILYFSPHQDDELLSMGIDICNSISEGHDIHVILCTDGSKCTVRHELANGKACNKCPGTHTYHLTEEDLINARDKEFRESCRALGVKDGHVHILKNRFTDRKLTVCDSKKTILHYLNVLGPDCVVCTLDPNLENNRQHRDHKGLGYAAVELFNEGFISELRLFTEPYFAEFFQKKKDVVRGKIRTAVDTATALVQEKVQKAAEAYSHWAPEIGRYAVGYHDIAKAFDTLLKNGTSYCHICTRENAAPEPGVSRCRKLVISLTSYPDRLNSTAKTLASVFEQSLPLDAVILWLASADFPHREKDLPDELVKMTAESGLSVRWYGSEMKIHDKYLWVINAYQDAFVIAVDDDMLCHNRFIENLYHSYLFCHQKAQNVSICFAPVSVAGELSLYEADLYKVVTYCKDEVTCIKNLQDKNLKLQIELIKKNNRIIRLAREIGRLKRELKKQD
jgi:glycosyltransferase involved in cell wall biosynthesis